MFRYAPGDVVIMHSGDLYHVVDTWKPTATMEKGGITPGRVGMVYFSPATALLALEGKPPGWMRDTCGGSAPTLDRKFSRGRKRRGDQSDDHDADQPQKKRRVKARSMTDSSDEDESEKEYQKSKKDVAGPSGRTRRNTRIRDKVIMSESDGSIDE